MEALLEETIAQQCEIKAEFGKSFTCLLSHLAQENLYDKLTYQINSISAQALFLEWWLD